MTALICGSIAYDTLMLHPNSFSDAILPDQLDKINVSFLVPDMKREFGGTGGNIAYNLKLLGDKPMLMATIGQDGIPYLEHFSRLGISTRYIKTIPQAYTAQCFATSDRNNNQINSFHPGAMAFSHENHITDADQENISLAIVAPDGRDGMIQHAEDCARLGIPFIFDPGQGLMMFSRDELRRFIDIAAYVIVNDYESEVLSKNSGLSPAEIASKVDAYITTLAEKGAKIYLNKGDVLDIPSIPVSQAVDPTGCGDAFRAGLIYGLTHGFDWKTSGCLGSLMGGIKIEQMGAQNHHPSPAEIEDRFEKTFGYRFR